MPVDCDLGKVDHGFSGFVTGSPAAVQLLPPQTIQHRMPLKVVRLESE